MNHLMKCVGAALTSLVMAGAAQAETVLIANDPGPNRGVRAAAVQHLSDQIAERTGGAVTIENNWGGALFKTTAALDSFSTGVADLGVLVGAYAQSELPELNIGVLPLPKAGPWVMMKSLHELYTTNEAIKARLADQNIVYINHYALPPGLVGCKGEGHTSLEAMNGIKFSNTGGLSRLFGELGANLVQMPVYEVYQGMETGLIDCTITYSYFAVATKLDELLDSIMPLKFSSTTVVITVMNKDSFDSLTPEQQTAILEVGADMADYYGEALAAADTKSMTKMTEVDGIKLVEFNEAEQAVMQEASKVTTEDWLSDAEATGLDGQATIDELVAVMAKWQNEVDTKGFPWERN